MKVASVVLLMIVLTCSASAQQPVKSVVPFDIADFQKKVADAEWLVEYDRVAWQTTDVLMKEDKKELGRLGAEWFCFKDKSNIWHAVYGKLGDAGYEAVFHYTMDASDKITRSSAKVDQPFLDGHARALSIGRDKLMKSIPEGSPRFNQYVRQNSDKTYSVWLLPAFQTNGVAVYGGEGIYTVDATGKNIIKDESYFQPAFRGFKAEPPREIWLNYRETQKPTLGAVFFVWYYKPYFTKIFIDNEKSVSTVIKTDQGYIWTHVEKDAQPKSKPN